MSVIRQLIGCALLLFAFASQAHESRPAYLQVTLTSGDEVRTHIKVPARGQLRLGLYARFPGHCVAAGQPNRFMVNDAFSERAIYLCAGGLTGHTISVDGLTSTLTDMLVRVQRADGSVQVARLTPDQPQFVVEASPSIWQVASSYFALGVEHIISGIDHLLFVMALVLLVSGAKRLFWTITAFTLAHSITLGAATLGWIAAPQRAIEAVIALSIVYVAAEIIRSRRGQARLIDGRPWMVAFAFGLLHGFGFAGALVDIGLPQTAVPAALLFFNLGVEAGQLLFIAGLLTIGWCLARVKALVHAPWREALAYGIGGIAAYWTIERVASIVIS